MKQKIVKVFFLLSLLMPLQNACTDRVQESCTELNTPTDILHNYLVYIGSKARRSIVELENLLPDYQWSQGFKNLCLDIKDEGTVAFHQQVSQVVDEC